MVMKTVSITHVKRQLIQLNWTNSKRQLICFLYLLWLSSYKCLQTLTILRLMALKSFALIFIFVA